MKIRTKEIKVRLSDDELTQLNEIVRELGISRESYIRSLLKYEIPRGKPTEEYLEILYQLRQIGNNINQIAIIAHQTRLIDEMRFQKAFEKLNSDIAEIKRIASQPIVFNKDQIWQ